MLAAETVDTPESLTKPIPTHTNQTNNTPQRQAIPKDDSKLLADIPGNGSASIGKEAEMAEQYLQGVNFDLSINSSTKPFTPFDKDAQNAPKWANMYLESLLEHGGFLVKAAEASGINYNQAYRAQIVFPDFKIQVEAIREYWRSHHLDQLESVSMTQALKPGCMPERAMQLKAHSDKYRDRGKDSNTTIIVRLGVDIPKPNYEVSNDV